MVAGAALAGRPVAALDPGEVGDGSSVAVLPGMPTSRLQPAGPEAAPAAAPAVNPAWSYLTLGYDSFHPTTALTTTVDGNGIRPTAGDGTFVYPLHLPQGAVLREATFYVYNVSTSTGLSVGIGVLTPPSTFVGGTFAFTSPTAGVHTVTISSISIGNPVDNTTLGYFLSSYLQAGGQFALQGARIAWENGLVLTPVRPQVRKLDTRLPGPLTGKVVDGQTITVPLTPELPAGAKLALANVTITETEGAGYLSLFPAGTPFPGTSTINWSGPGAIVANDTTVAVSTSGALSVYCGGTSARTHVIIDLLGYYA